MKRAVIGIALVAAMVSGCTTVDGQSKPISAANTARLPTATDKKSSIHSEDEWNFLLYKATSLVVDCTFDAAKNTYKATDMNLNQLSYFIYTSCFEKYKVQAQVLQAKIYDVNSMSISLSDIMQSSKEKNLKEIELMILKFRERSGMPSGPTPAPAPAPAQPAAPSNERAA